jgi:hypothetical protein
MSRYARRSKIRRRPREGARQTVGVVAMGIALALGVVATDEFVTALRKPAEAAAKAAAPSDDEIYTGSILFTPIEGRICHQFLFDNRTGRISDKGNVDCERAQQGAGSKNSPVARARAVSAAFRGR